MISAGGGYPSAVVTREVSASAAATKPSPADEAATSPARARVSTATAVPPAKPQNFAHISARILSLTVAGTKRATDFLATGRALAMRGSPGRADARYRNVAFGRQHNREQDHPTQDSSRAEALAQYGEMVDPVEHGQNRTVRCQGRAKVGNRGVETVSLAGDKHDVIRTPGIVREYGLDRRAVFSIWRLDDESAVGKLRRPPRPHQKSDIGTTPQQHAAVVSAERASAEYQKSHVSPVRSPVFRCRVLIRRTGHPSYAAVATRSCHARRRTPRRGNNRINATPQP
jgi:hypothetical protein